MNKLKVRNFGPIRDGFRSGDGFLEFPKVTLFCGPQGSGKSSIAKLYSVLVWVEKIFHRYSLVSGGKSDADFFNEALEWQGIDSYLREESEIIYDGLFVHLEYHNGAYSWKRKDAWENYMPRQVMYIPAERNFASIVKNAAAVEMLPKPLREMQVEFHAAMSVFGKGYKLPANGYSFVHDPVSDEAWISNDEDGQKTKLNHASSGLQSIVPLLLTSEYVLEKVVAGRKKEVRETRSAKDELISREVVRDAKKDLQRGKITEVEYDAILKRVSQPSQGFVNIVEEPEQNLYPATQCDIICRLLGIVNALPLNQLVVSTHSPYVVNAFVASQMVAQLLTRISDCRPDDGKRLIRKVNGIFPVKAALDKKDMALYELDGRGVVRRLPTKGRVFSDEHSLNRALGKWNELFDELLMLEARLNG